MPSPLVFDSATKFYRRSHLGRVFISRGVEDLSLELERGEILGLLGLNGSGKTTSFKLALGLLDPSGGRVLLMGKPPRSPEARARVGYLPEVPTLPALLTAREALEFYGGLSGLQGADLRSRVAKTLERTGLSSLAGKRTGELSKGLRQRLALSQAVIHSPELAILDEPASGLDPVSMKALRETLRSLNSEGMTILLSSHNIPDLSALCHRVAVLHAGRLAALFERKDWEDEKGGLDSLFDSILSNGNEK